MRKLATLSLALVLSVGVANASQDSSQQSGGGKNASTTTQNHSPPPTVIDSKPTTDTPAKSGSNAAGVIDPERQIADDTHDLAKSTDRLAWATAFLVFISAFQIRFLIRADRTNARAANAATDSVAQMRANAARELRAYVFTGTVGMHPDRDEQGGLRFNVEWKNTGSTPTRHLVISQNSILLPNEETANFDFPDSGTEVRMLIAPHSPISGMASLVNADQVRKIAAAESHLYIWGWADYNDVFEGTPRHRTEFYFKIGLKNIGEELPVLGVSFVTHRANAFDDDCSRQPKPYEQT